MPPAGIEPAHAVQEGADISVRNGCLATFASSGVSSASGRPQGAGRSVARQAHGAAVLGCGAAARVALNALARRRHRRGIQWEDHHVWERLRCRSRFAADEWTSRARNEGRTATALVQGSSGTVPTCPQRGTVPTCPTSESADEVVDIGELHADDIDEVPQGGGLEPAVHRGASTRDQGDLEAELSGCDGRLRNTSLRRHAGNE